MSVDDQTNGSPASRMDSRKLLAMGAAVGVSVLSLIAILTSDISGAESANQTAEFAAFSPAAGISEDPLTPRAALSVGRAEVLPEPGQTAVAEARDTVLTVRPGHTLAQILGDAGIAPQEGLAAIAELKPLFNPRRLVPGQTVTLRLRPGEGETAGLDRLTIVPEPGRRVIAERMDDGSFAAHDEQDPIAVEAAAFHGTIASSLFAAGEKAGVPPGILQQMIRLFSYDVDFQRDIRSGDSFEVMADRSHLPDGTPVGDGEIDYAALTLSGVTMRLYRFESASGEVDYFNEKGQSVRKALLRTPVDGARITSSFGMRNHPILGFSKMHKGVDFGTPVGTPVYAAGNGVVEKEGPWGAYGNYLRIRHTGTYATAYGHLSGYARGIHPGVRVRQGQVVAYSGNTGRTTGPHLHYEVLISGAQVNPLNVKMPAGRTLAGEEARQFARLRANLDRTYAQAASGVKVAAAADAAKTR